MTIQTCRLFAPAKINLDLMITGRRPDGYHILKSHVAFADVGDDIQLNIIPSDATTITLTTDGSFASQLSALNPEHNLAVQAARKFCDLYQQNFTITIGLTKNLPTGAGLGGGSSDAAAIWRGLMFLTQNAAHADTLKTLLSIGADVPVCYHAQPCVMEGIGEILSPWSFSPQNAILIWPGEGGSTTQLYQDFDESPPQHATPNSNAFEALAIRHCPAIQEALTALRTTPHCNKAALSGSGTAVFGLFGNSTPPTISARFPWVQPCQIGAITKPLVMRL